MTIKPQNHDKVDLHSGGGGNNLIKLTFIFCVGFYGTATQFRLYSAGECVVNVRVSVCAEYSGVVPHAPSSSG